jgi:putative transposase
MIWTPSKLTREQMEERRLEGGRLLKEGKLSQAEIARRLGVTRGSVTAWSKALQAGGVRRLRQHKSTGRPSKLNREVRRKLKRLLDRGALAAGFPTDRWTLVRVSELLKKEFDIRYHPNSLRRVLDQLGYSVQKPMPRAAERDEELVKAWLEKDWPRIKKGTSSRRNDRLLR